MKNDARTSSAMFMSLLDLVSCALGASIILAVVFSVIENPIPSPKVDDFLSARFVADKDVKLGVILYHENSGEQISLTPEAIHYVETQQIITQEKGLAKDIIWFSSKLDGGSEAYFTLHINKPQIGKWVIAPYIYSYANNLVKTKVETISARWRNKTSVNDIVCVNKNIKNDVNLNPYSDKGESVSGVMPVTALSKQCIQSAEEQKFAVISHEFI